MPTSPQGRTRWVYQLLASGASATEGVGIVCAVLVLGTGVAAAAIYERAIDSKSNNPSMAAVPVVEIGRETRPVLTRANRRVLALNERVRMPEGTFEIPVRLPRDLARGTRVKLEAHVTLRDPKLKGSKDMHDLRDVGRIRLDASPLVAEAGRPEPTLSLRVPPELVGSTGLLTVLARELPPEATVASAAGPWAVRPGDRLEFGFGVEPAGWDAEYPPVRFRVFARPEGGEDLLLWERHIDPAREPRDRRWRDASIGLDALAGSVASFRFEGTAQASAGAPQVDRSWPVFSNPRLRRPDEGDARPSIVLISLDTLRARSVGAYGYRHPTTPQLDERLVAAGALVREAVVPVPFTPPSHMTMLTGLAPCAHGVTDRDGILAPEDLLLAEILRAAGYDTAAFTENAYVVAGAGFARGFDTYVEQRADASAHPGFGAETFRAAEEWLVRKAHPPFFLFVHTYQVHQPYTPPRGYRHLFGDFPESDERKDRWKADEQAYDQEIRYTDDLLGSFLDVLDERDLAEDTIVVVTSDHGEEFGAHDWGGHGFGLWDTAVLVPLVFRAPGRIEPGTVVEPQVGIVDLVPTLLDLVGVRLPRPVQGQSFAALLTGRDPRGFDERPLVSRTTGFDFAAVRTRLFKYIKRRGEMLYRLDTDPGETEPVTAEYPVALLEGRQALETHETDCRAYREAHPVTSGKDPLFEQRPDWLINRNEIDRKLRSLGYVE